jgi:hypothetical protein
MRYSLCALFLCLALLAGCANSTVTVTTGGSATSTTSTTSSTSVAATSTPAPSATAAPAGLNAIDWLNTSYPDLCQMNGGAPVTVVNGYGPLSNTGVRLHVFDPLFGYISRKNALDVIVPFGCIGHMDTGTSILVYSGDSSSPKMIGQLPLTAPQYPLMSVLTEGILAQKLELSGYGFSSGAVPECCPDVWVTDTYTWNGSAFILSAHQATKLGAQLYP